MNTQIKFPKKTKKAEFEQKIVAEYAGQKIVASRHSEFDHLTEKNIPMTLYYIEAKNQSTKAVDDMTMEELKASIDTNPHVGTFCKSGSTWMFEKKAV